MIASDDDCTTVAGNLMEARKSWARISRILVREGENPKLSGMFSKAVGQAVLISRAETWVTTPCMGRYLEGGSTQGILQDHWEASPEVTGRDLGVSTSGNRYEGGVF